MSNFLASKPSEQEILERLRGMLAANFEISPSKVVPEASLYSDLELDSIDAVDLVIQLQEMTGTRIKPEDFKTVRTVADVVAVVQKLTTA